MPKGKKMADVTNLAAIKTKNPAFAGLVEQIEQNSNKILQGMRELFKLKPLLEEYTGRKL